MLITNNVHQCNLETRKFATLFVQPSASRLSANHVINSIMTTKNLNTTVLLVSSVTLSVIQCICLGIVMNLEVDEDLPIDRRYKNAVILAAHNYDTQFGFFQAIRRLNFIALIELKHNTFL